MGDTFKLPFGIYEQVLNQIITKKLRLNSEDEAVLENIDEEEASKVLSKYISDVIEKGLANIKDNGGGIQKQKIGGYEFMPADIEFVEKIWKEWK